MSIFHAINVENCISSKVAIAPWLLLVGHDHGNTCCLNILLCTFEVHDSALITTGRESTKGMVHHKKHA